ncbi:CoA pyrophosphatase [Microbacterium sp. cx-59]|uniref:NUDIX hydrolase n=1 Tax=Microbacterium sp. cx-59 TaxID=2891207 RepID=UPI001E2D27FD|nr:CoA pyrophosphatase [Microbacterium sp. cx-59]MCC4907540.1 CoA pyrophosphatase [Microbacterium sp. cx-59]
MPSDAALRTAREQLVDLARGDGFAGAAHALIDLPTVPDPRPAAILILFGVLDGRPSTAETQASAVSRDLDVLLLSRATTLRAHPGQVAFPGGRLDPEDLGPVDAALREAREETGLDPRGVDVLGVLPDVPLAFSGHVVTPVLGWWRHPTPVGVVDTAESSDVFRAPVADLLDPANRGVTVLRRDGREFRGPGFRVAHTTGEHLVWGFTAMLLAALFDRLGWTEPWDQARELPLVL